MFIKKYTLLVLPFLFILSGCGLNRASVPTPLPTYTQPSSPTSPPATETTLPTSTAEFVATATNIATATPPPVCHVGETIESATNGSLPSYIDIVKVSTKLSGSKFSATFTMNWLPDQIMIDRNILGYGAAEIAWGVAIDVDNDPNTGSSIPLTSSGYGYDYVLQAANFKEGEEVQGGLQALFSDKVNVWEVFADGSNSVLHQGKIYVDTATASITLSGDIKGIKKDSYLQFFAIYFPTASQQLTDEICQR